MHYLKISEIVKATAIEFNVPYHENETFVGALKSHYKVLKEFGHNHISRKSMAQVEAVA